MLQSDCRATPILSVMHLSTVAVGRSQMQCFRSFGREFKSKLKTHLFKCAFKSKLDNLIFCFYISKSYCNTMDVKRLERMWISAI